MGKMSVNGAPRQKDKKDRMKKFPLVLVVLFVLFILLVGAAFGIYKWFFSPVSFIGGDVNTDIKITIPRGTSVVKIADILYEHKLIRHPLAFRLAVKLGGLDSKLQAGSFEIPTSLSPTEIAQKLTEGTRDTWITIIEGWRVEEIADYLATQELTAFDKTEFLSATASLEGKLYPDSYLVPKEITTTAIIDLFTRTYQKKILDELGQGVKNSHLTSDEIITMASILEREARGSEQMRRVAGILFNRLEIGMPLQVDASLQYIKGYDQASGSWWALPIAADKTLQSPYNTYVNPGLPRGPICNPSQEAVKSVLDPIVSNDLFYLHAPDGSIHYAQTLEDHNANVNRYLR